MENKDDIISSVNSSSSPRSKISDLLPSDILEEIGVPKIHKNPKVSISSSNLKYASLNDDEINEKYLMNHINGSSKFIYHSNLNVMNVKFIIVIFVINLSKNSKELQNSKH